MFDVLRIDHFRGFEAYWEIPYGAANATEGKWTKGPDLELFNELEKQLGKLPIICRGPWLNLHQSLSPCEIKLVSQE